ncbi:maleylpyruvate isomerase family mycothiol-dependent enzyme [Nocardioides speluncae]|uniref:maleylpyruvate isomerase family mycothiol-dependent enzyme n=1 Tax=Nocardioides speluncae TaxID=2670337 RepID=UPI000D687D28|nr:maleylpyruvate isomerase family mycothiol-dependent enzyme [Nocardioides speluncae]
MERENVWRHIHAERAALADTLGSLTAEQWEHESLCAGWTVKDVAAHVISTAKIKPADMVGIMGRNLGRGYNKMIFREVKRLSHQQSVEQILADYTTYATSTRKVPTVTVIEPLIDAIVHHQDIVRPLGIIREPDPAAAAVAADRCRTLSLLFGSRRVVKGVRMVATDVDWTRGRGPTVEGPMRELLMLCAGRAGDPALLSGDGLELVST